MATLSTSSRSRSAGVPPSSGRRLERPKLWVLQFGPCWCRSDPHEEGSFDLVRFRTAEVGPQALERDILVVSRRVMAGSSRMLQQVRERIPRPPLLVASGHCPGAARFWEDLPGGWTPLEELLSLDISVDRCFSGYPEVVLAAILGHPEAASVEEEDRTARAAVETVRA